MTEFNRDGQPIGEDEFLDAAKAARDQMDPDRACEHPDFAANVAVNRLTKSDDDPTIVAFMADIHVSCMACGERFRWTGVETGMSPRRPMVSVDGLELHAPLRPASADPDFGMGLPEFTIRRVD